MCTERAKSTADGDTDGGNDYDDEKNETVQSAFCGGRCSPEGDGGVGEWAGSPPPRTDRPTRSAPAVEKRTSLPPKQPAVSNSVTNITKKINRLYMAPRLRLERHLLDRRYG